MTTEFELKFQVDAQHRAPVEASVARGSSQRTRLQARYFDTPDGALAAQHVVLRLRKEGKAWVQTAKGPAQGPLLRFEHNVDIPSAGGAGDVPPQPRLERHEGTPVGELVAKALRKAGHDPAHTPLVALYGTDVWRTTRTMRTGDALVELAFDRGEVRAGNRSRALCELEIELKQGSPQSMLELAQRWRGRYRLWLDTVSKSARGERLAQATDFGPPTPAEPPVLDAHADGPEIFRAVIGACLSQILPNASELAAGSTDGEHVHQLRVGIRRLRTALREMAGLVPAVDPAWEPALVEAFRALGRRRDREHLQQVVQPRLEALGGPAMPWDETPEDAAPEPGEVVRAPAFQAVLMSLIAASLPPDESDAAAHEGGVGVGVGGDARKLLRARLSALHRRLLRDGARFEALSPFEQHRVRKRLKRLRYLLEFTAPLFGRSEARRYLKELRPAQDALGEHNDAAMAMATCRERAAEDGRAWFAIGWLTAQQPASAAQCRRALDRLAEAEPFWQRSKDGKR